MWGLVSFGYKCNSHIIVTQFQHWRALQDMFPHVFLTLNFMGHVVDSSDRLKQ